MQMFREYCAIREMRGKFRESGVKYLICENFHFTGKRLGFSTTKFLLVNTHV